MVKPFHAQMRSAILLGSLLALLPPLPALAADPTPAAEAPGPQLRAPGHGRAHFFERRSVQPIGLL